MSLYQKLKADILAYRKAGDTESVKKLTTVLSDIETANLKLVKVGGDIPDSEVVKVIRKFANNLKETVSYLEADEVGNHDILVDLGFELNQLESYLPRELNPVELRTACELAVNDSQASSMKDMGKVMSELKRACEASGVIYDGGLASTIVREILLAA